jgi:uncharacterized membrane protein YesL
MAGFLGIGNYAKPGPGVGKDEDQRHDFFIFFELYFRKFWNLCVINMLYFAFCIPFFIPCFFVEMYNPRNAPLFYLSLVPVIGISVITSGLTYILRNFARQEHTFLWMDFIDTIKKNWRQSLAVGAIDFIFYFIMLFSIGFYNKLLSVNSWYLLPLILSVIVTAIFTFMQFYIYLMLISFELTIKQLFKNAFILSFAGFGRNIIVTIFCGLLALGVFIFWPASALLIPFILISTFGFIIVFNIWPIIKSYLIPEAATNGESEDGDVKDAIFKDTGRTN